MISVLRLPQVTGSPGQRIAIPVYLDSIGIEEALSFSVHFSPHLLANPSVELGADTLAAGFSLTVNANQAGNGRIGVLMDDSPTDAALAAGDRHVATINFDVVGISGISGLEFAATPIGIGGADVMANNIAIGFQNGDVVVGGGQMPSPRPVQVAAIPGQTATGGGPINNTDPPYYEPLPSATLPPGTLPGVRDPANPGHIEPDATIFGFSPIVVIGAAAVALYFYSSSK